MMVVSGQRVQRLERGVLYETPTGRLCVLVPHTTQAKPEFATLAYVPDDTQQVEHAPHQGTFDLHRRNFGILRRAR